MSHWMGGGGSYYSGSSGNAYYSDSDDGSISSDYYSDDEGRSRRRGRNSHRRHRRRLTQKNAYRDSPRRHGDDISQGTHTHDHYAYNASNLYNRHEAQHRQQQTNNKTKSPLGDWKPAQVAWIAIGSFVAVGVLSIIAAVAMARKRKQTQKDDMAITQHLAEHETTDRKVARQLDADLDKRRAWIPPLQWKNNDKSLAQGQRIRRTYGGHAASEGHEDQLQVYSSGNAAMNEEDKDTGNTILVVCAIPFSPQMPRREWDDSITSASRMACSLFNQARDASVIKLLIRMNIPHDGHEAHFHVDHECPLIRQYRLAVIEQKCRSFASQIECTHEPGANYVGYNATMYDLLTNKAGYSDCAYLMTVVASARFVNRWDAQLMAQHRAAVMRSKSHNLVLSLDIPNAVEAVEHLRRVGRDVTSAVASNTSNVVERTTIQGDDAAAAAAATEADPAGGVGASSSSTRMHVVGAMSDEDLVQSIYDTGSVLPGRFCRLGQWRELQVEAGDDLLGGGNAAIHFAYPGKTCQFMNAHVVCVPPSLPVRSAWFSHKLVFGEKTAMLQCLPDPRFIVALQQDEEASLWQDIFDWIHGVRLESRDVHIYHPSKSCCLMEAESFPRASVAVMRRQGNRNSLSATNLRLLTGCSFTLEALMQYTRRRNQPIVVYIESTSNNANNSSSIAANAPEWQLYGKRLSTNDTTDVATPRSTTTTYVRKHAIFAGVQAFCSTTATPVAASSSEHGTMQTNAESARQQQAIIMWFTPLATTGMINNERDIRQDAKSCFGDVATFDAEMSLANRHDFLMPIQVYRVVLMPRAAESLLQRRVHNICTP